MPEQGLESANCRTKSSVLGYDYYLFDFIVVVVVVVVGGGGDFVLVDWALKTNYLSIWSGGGGGGGGRCL